MENVSATSGTSDQESAPLLPQKVNVKVKEDKGDQIYDAKTDALADLASEVSKISLEASNQPIAELTGHQQESKETPTVETGNSSADGVEDTSLDQISEVDDPSADDNVDQDKEVDQALDAPVDPTSSEVLKVKKKKKKKAAKRVGQSSTEGGLSESVSEFYRTLRDELRPPERKCLDRKVFVLMIEVLLLAFPISMAYYGITNFHQCPSSDKLPKLLLALAFFSALTLLVRIMTSIGRKCCPYERDIVPPLVVCTVEFVVVAVFIAEFISYLTMDSTLCTAEFYEYLFLMNTTAAAFTCIIILCNFRKIFICYRVMRYDE